MKDSMVFYYLFRILSLALPISFSRLLYMLAGFIAVMMLGRLGPMQLAAGVLAISTFSVVLVFTSSVFQSLSIQIRKMPKGQTTHNQVASLFQSSVFLAGLISIPSALFLWHANTLLLIIGQKVEIVAMTRLYFHYCAIVIVPSLFVNVINQLTMGLGRSSPLLYIELFSFFPRISLYYCFIHGAFSIPAMGLAGIALAELFIKVSVLLGLLIRFQISKFYKPYKSYLAWRKWYFNFYQIRFLLRTGLPIALQSSGEIAAMSIAGFLMGYFGATALAALSITNQYMISVMMLTYGLSQALTLLISEIGREAHADAKIRVCLFVAVTVMTLYCTPFIMIFLSAPSSLLTLFVPREMQDLAIQALTKSFFIISAFFIVIEGLRNIVIGALWAVLNSYRRLMSGLGMIWFAALPLSYLFAFTLQGGPVGLRVGFLLGLFISFILLTGKLFQRLQQRKEALSLQIAD